MADVAIMQEPTIQILSSLGVSGITAFLGYLWIKKDKQYTDLSDRVLIAFNKNTQSHVELKAAIKNNTKITEKLETSITNRVFEVLKEK